MKSNTQQGRTLSARETLGGVGRVWVYFGGRSSPLSQLATSPSQAQAHQRTALRLKNGCPAEDWGDWGPV
jgi:hypothetical protein